MYAGDVAGVCVIRNAVDLVPFLCGHYLRSGFAHLVFVDDGSSDGTFEHLNKIANRTRRVSVRRAHSDVCDQQTLMTEAANGLITAGFRIIVPFDADEFWNAESTQFERLFASAPEALVSGKWVNFVQSRGCQVSSRRGLLNMVYQAPAMADANRETITECSQSFVCHAATKIAIKTRSNVEISLGQHELLKGPNCISQAGLEIFHLPLRSRHELFKRANNEPRRAPKRAKPGISWQSKFHRDIVVAGKVDAVWAANSYDSHGRLDIYGTPMCLIYDTRLRRLLIRAIWHLVAACGPLRFIAALYHKSRR